MVMRLALAFIKRDFLLAISYRMAFVIQVLGIFVAVAFFYFISQMVDGAAPPALAKYGGNYFAFLLIGIAFADYLGLSLKTFNDSLRESQLMGTLEIILLSPTPLSQILVYSSLYGYLFTSIRFVLYLLLGLLFGLDMHDANYVAAVALLIMAVASFASLGIVIASITMVIKRGDTINTMVSAAFVLLGGAIYPVTVLPAWMQSLSQLLPMTHALEGMRLALMGGYSTEQLLPQFLALFAFSAVLLPIGFCTFWLAVRWTKITGSLAHY